MGLPKPPDTFKSVDSGFYPGVATPLHGTRSDLHLLVGALLARGSCLPCKRLSLVPGVETEIAAKSFFSKITFGFTVGEFGLGKAHEEIPFILVSRQPSGCSKL